MSNSPRSRDPSSRFGAQAMPDSREGLRPQDSASNAPSRRNTSGSTRITSERQTERIRFSTRENARVRMRSPVRGDHVGDRASKVLEQPRVSSGATERLPTATSKKQETLRELRLNDYDYVLLRCHADILTLQHPGIPRSRSLLTPQHLWLPACLIPHLRISYRHLWSLPL